MSRYQTKAQTVAEWRQSIRPSVDKHGPDYPARRESWNNYIDEAIRYGSVPESAGGWSHPPENTSPAERRAERARKARTEWRAEQRRKVARERADHLEHLADRRARQACADRQSGADPSAPGESPGDAIARQYRADARQLRKAAQS